MKTQQLHKYTLLLLFLLPATMHAQWSMVRFDKHNFFQAALTVDADNAFVMGMEPNSQAHFVLRTSNGGTSWDSLNLNPDESLFEISKLHFLDKNTGFIGGAKDFNHHLIKTTDNGDSWTDVSPPLEVYKEITAISFVNENTGFASNGEFLYKTTNGGSSWITYFPDFEIRDMVFTDANTGFASGTQMDSMNRGVLMKTTNGGETWQYLLTYRNPSLFVTYFHKIDFIDAKTMFTSVQNTNQLFLTTNGGATWDTISVDSANFIADYDFTSAQSGHIINEKSQIFYTNDGGKTWQLQYSAQWGLYGPDVFLVSLSIKDGSGYVSGSNGLIKKYTSTVSVAEPANAFQFGIFPNPLQTGNTLQITLPQAAGNGTIHIVNALGQVVESKKLHAGDNRSINLDKLTLAPGLYYISVIQNNKRAVQKLIVNQ